MNGADAVPAFELTPRLPAQNSGPIDQQNALNLGSKRSIEESQEGGPQPAERVAGGLGAASRSQQILFHLLEDGLEQGTLIAEVVIQRPAGPDARRGYDLLGTRVEVTLLDKQLSGGSDQRRTGGFRLDGARSLRGIRRLLTPRHALSIFPYSL